MTLKWIVFLLLYSIAFAGFAQSISKGEQQKLDFLKSELVNSNCLFERNGKQYNAKKALKHINRKHSHFEDDIDSVSKFIELTATQSSMSGKPYFIICEDNRVESAIWLNKKLSQAQNQK
jgi:Family of unknown function (DUF5329)